MRNRLIAFAILMFCWLLSTGSATASVCSVPRFTGDVYAVALTGDLAGSVVYFVFDGDDFSEYVYSRETAQTRLLVTTRMTMSALPDGTRQYVFQVPAREGRPAEQVRFITDDSDLIVPGDVRIARVFDPELPVPTFAQANPRMGNQRLHLGANAAPPLKARPNLAILCCAACWGTHAALTVDSCAGTNGLPCMDYNAAFDWLCCGGGC